MESSNIRDILTAFNPSLDLFAISLGDGRIKIWDTVKGQIQTEFADIASSGTTNIFGQQEGGHLSIDYTCMRWLSVEKKKKRKLGSSLLILGTGGGDVLALDVSAGQLKWRVNDCHPGGVSAVSFPSHGSCIYTAGADGMVCELDSMSGNLLSKFRASTKALSSISVSPDGTKIATAAAQIKIFDCLNHKKLQKFSGHPAPVRCMSFIEDGRYLLSSAVGERYIGVWQIDGSKRQSACSFLAMDHPAVLLDSKSVDGIDANDAGLCILSISEMGVCYFWHGKEIDDLRNLKPTKMSVSGDGYTSKHKGETLNVFAAKLQNVSEPACGHVFLARGLLVKPSFERVLVQSGKDIELKSSRDGILLPNSQVWKSKKTSDAQNQITALDRANAEGALLPLTKVFDLDDVKNEVKPVSSEVDTERMDIGAVSMCMEEQLRSLGILGSGGDLAVNSFVDPRMLKVINLEANVPQKKMKETISSMEPRDAFDLFKGLVDVWKSRLRNGKYVLPWICCILVYHSDYIISQEPSTQLLDSLYKLAKSKGAALNSLLQFSGRLQLVTAQVDKAVNNMSHVSEHDELSDEREDDVDDVLYGVDDDSQTGSDVEY